MEIKQIYQFVNTATQETLGNSAVVNEDLSNIVTVGDEIFNANAVDAYVRSLVNHIGKVIFVNRPYAGTAPSVLMDGWEFGSVLEKITADLPTATENESWELEDNTSYDPNIFYKPTVSAKFFNFKTTFEVPMSFTEKQVKQSFSSVEQLNGFISMLYTAVEKSMTVKLDDLIMRTVNNMIAETIHDDYPTGTYNTSSGVKAVNLLYLYNQKFGTQLTANDCCTNQQFLQFASYTMGLYEKRLAKISTLFNIGGRDRFTSAEYLHVVMLAEFMSGANYYLENDTFHNDLVALPKAESVAYWQGSGVDYSFNSTSKIDVKTASGDTVSTTGILAVMFDRDALGVTNMDRRVTTNYNPKAEFYTNWYKMDAGYFNDLNENCVVFFVA